MEKSVLSRRAVLGWGLSEVDESSREQGLEVTKRLKISDTKDAVMARKRE